MEKQNTDSAKDDESNRHDEFIKITHSYKEMLFMTALSMTKSPPQARVLVEKTLFNAEKEYCKGEQGLNIGSWLSENLLKTFFKLYSNP
ncbi:MAG: hypothetical protein ACE5HS_16495 [bacterium]